MAASSEPVNPAPEDDSAAWPSNYFNYFTEIEEHFQRARGSGLFLLSPLDWALLEMWKNSGVPLEAVLRGIDAAFEKWRTKKNRTQHVNSVAYCAQAVMMEAQALAGSAASTEQARDAAPFALDELRSFLARNAVELRRRPEYGEIAGALERMVEEAETLYADLQQTEQRLTALEDKLTAIARTARTEEDLFRARRELDTQLRPYRGKMSTEQLAMLERQYLDRRIFEDASLPRLSLFYLR